MPYLSSKRLAESLFPDDKSAEAKITHLNHGPGEMEKWLALLGEENCWVKTEPDSKLSSRNKIIFSNPLLNARAPTKNELAIWVRLIADYDIYLWEGPDKPIYECRPIKTTTDFWDRRGEAIPATEAEVKKALSKMPNVNAYEFTVLDYIQFESLKKKLLKLPDLMDSLDLKLIPLNTNHDYQNILKSIDPKKIKKVHMVAPNDNDIKFLINSFSPDTEIHISGHSNEWINKNIKKLIQFPIVFHLSTGLYPLALPSLPYKSLSIIGLSGVSYKAIEIADIKNELMGLLILKDYKIIDEKSKLEFVSNIIKKIPHVKLDNCPGILKLCDNLKSVTEIKKSPNIASSQLDKITLEKNQLSNKELIHIINNGFDFYPPSKLKTFKKLIIENGNFDYKILYTYPNIEELTFIDTYHVKYNNIDFSFFKYLKKLTVIHKDRPFSQGRLHENDLKKFEVVTKFSIPTLESFHLESNIVTSLDLSNLPSLKEFSAVSTSLESITSARELFIEHMNLDCSLFTANFPAKNSPSCAPKIDKTISQNILVLTSTDQSESEIRYMKKIERLTYTVNNELLPLTLENSKLKDVLIKARSNAVKSISLSTPILTTFKIIDDTYRPNFCGVIFFDGAENLKELFITAKQVAVLGKNDFEAKQIRSLALFQSSPIMPTFKLGLTGLPSSITDPEQHKLAKLNAESPVSLCTLDYSEKIDNDTGPSKAPTISRGDFKITLYGKNIEKSYYRVHILDGVEFKNDKIKFIKTISTYLNNNTITKPLDANTVDRVKTFVDQKTEYALGNFTGIVNPGQYYPLATQDTGSNKTTFDVYCSPHNSIDVFWNEKEKMHYFKLKDNKAIDVNIVYLFRVNLSYSEISNEQPLEHKGNILPNDLRKIIETKLIATFSDAHPLAFLKTSVSIQERISAINKIAKYCAGFKEEKILRNSKDSIDKIFDTIIESKGVCRHRAKAFFLLTRYIGIPTNIIVSEVHQFCEIEYPSGWRRFDLGGGIINDLTPQEQRPNIFSKIPNSELQMLDTKSTPSTKSELTPIQVHYKSILSNLDKITVVESITSFVSKFIPSAPQILEADIKSSLAPIESTLSPFIIAKSSDDIVRIKQSIQAQLELLNQVDNSVFIDNPKDFETYLIHLYLKEGDIKKTEGPLENILKNGGMVIINWCYFTPDQIVRYQCILDKPPTLFEKTLSSKVAVINIGSKTNIQEKSFSSRCQPYGLDEKFFRFNDKQVEANQRLDEKTNPIEIDLFASQNWREDLFGKIEFKGNKIIATKGKLIESIEKNSPLIIYNQPIDPAFEVLIQQAVKEKRILHNNEYGKFIQIPPNMSIKLMNKEHKIELPNVNIQIDETKNSKEKIFLNLANFHELSEKTFFDLKTHQANSAPGMLDEYDEQSQVFYLTDRIPKMTWEKLINTIAVNSKYKNKTFNFVLAPNAGITDFKVGIKPVEPEHSVDEKRLKPSNYNIVVTNDPDYFIYSTTIQAPLIIDIYPETSISDLLYKLKIEKDPNDKTKRNFIYQQKGMLNALITKRKIILNGEPSATLYQQLLPLVSDKPYFNNNGIKIFPEAGQIKLVMPEKVKQRLLLTQYSEIIYSLKDLKSRFPDDANVDKIVKFYALANTVSHSSPGFPKPPTLNYAKLKSMLLALKKNSLHSQNPIKGLFLYDYPKISEEYAYLNVISKLLFGNDKKGMQLKKYEKLTENLNIFKESPWKLLNCLNAENLREIFKNTIPATMRAIPQLKNELLAQYSLYKSQLTAAANTNEAKRSHAQKREDQLRTILKDPEKPLIILKGPAGAGKTFTISKLLNLNYGEWNKKDIGEWLDKKKEVLLLDEANMATPGTWDFLKGITREDRAVYYEGTEYKLSANQKIIATGNPEHFPGRHYHDFFQNYGETIYFKMPNDNDLKQIIAPILGNKFQVFADKLIMAYHLINEYNPVFGYSTRDIENVAQRFISMADEKDMNSDSSLLRACIGEFAGSLSSPEKRQNFIFELCDKLKHPLPTANSQSLIELKVNQESFYFPHELNHVIEGIQQDLDMRAQGKKGYYKQGILLEGDPGLGKSFIYRTLLEKNGFRKGDAASDPKKRYYEINSGDAASLATLEKAYNEGAIVILNELNVDPEKKLETKLNQYLTNTTNSGFMVMASQNGSENIGRSPVSQAIYNRMHVMYMETCSRESQLLIAEKYKIQDPAFYVKFINDSNLSMRGFYAGLNMLKNKPVTPSPEPIASSNEKAGVRAP